MPEKEMKAQGNNKVNKSNTASKEFSIDLIILLMHPACNCITPLGKIKVQLEKSVSLGIGTLSKDDEENMMQQDYQH